ncbi:MAG TPA: GDP-mannose 4,6-dehydratase [Candidatus Binatia bacterium]|nr:GDP-mannose 4,6-dehydratase [Candidatus Binatia bacterium]
MTASLEKRALVTGVTGQDGSYLAHLLLGKGYRVFGAVRRTSRSNVARLEELDIAKDIELVDFDLLEFGNILRVVDQTRPDEIYNLAAQQPQSPAPGGIRTLRSNRLPPPREDPEPVYTGNCDGLGVARLLEAIRIVNPKIRFYQASSSEMFGKISEVPQTEITPLRPRGPYAVAKLYGHWMTANYRESYGIHGSSGILFNHESPLRGQEFVTRKITVSLAKIKYGELEVLYLGNLDAQRDWGCAADYVEGMWLMLQQPAGDDYVLASGEMHTVRDFVSASGTVLGLDIVFEGVGANERGIDRRTGRTLIQVNPKYYRPVDLNQLCGNPLKAEQALGWKRRTTFAQLVALMAEADDRRVRDKRLTF